MLTGGVVMSRLVCRTRLVMIFRSKCLTEVESLGLGRRMLMEIPWIAALQFLSRILSSRIFRLVSIMGRVRLTKKEKGEKIVKLVLTAK